MIEHHPLSPEHPDLQEALRILGLSWSTTCRRRCFDIGGAVRALCAGSACHDASVGLFKRSEAVRAKKVGAHARYVDEDVQRVDLKVTSTDGETATIDLSLDQTRQLVIDLTNAYGACRPALLDQKQVDRITAFFGMR